MNTNDFIYLSLACIIILAVLLMVQLFSVKKIKYQKDQHILLKTNNFVIKVNRKDLSKNLIDIVKIIDYKMTEQNTDPKMIALCIKKIHKFIKKNNCEVYHEYNFEPGQLDRAKMVIETDEETDDILPEKTVVDLKFELEYLSKLLYENHCEGYIDLSEIEYMLNDIDISIKNFTQNNLDMFNSVDIYTGIDKTKPVDIPFFASDYSLIEGLQISRF
jgi:hypothetical protein